MELAVITAQKISVMFVMALIGMVCYQVKLIDRHTNEKLSDILLLLVSPLLIFNSYQQEFDPGKLSGLLTAFVMAAASHAVAIAIASVAVKKGRKDYQVERMGVIYSNCGFMGIPLVNALFGAAGGLQISLHYCHSPGDILLSLPHSSSGSYIGADRCDC